MEGGRMCEAFCCPPWQSLPPSATRHRGAELGGQGSTWCLAQGSHSCIYQAPAVCQAQCKGLDKHCLPEQSAILKMNVIPI